MQLAPISPASIPWSSGVAGSYGLSSLAAGEGQMVAMQTVSSAGTIAAGTAPLWTQAAWAIPVIGAAVAGVALALTAWFSRKGPRQKVETTRIVNELEPYLKQNLEGYLNGPRTRSSQAQALANFDAVWSTLVENCRVEEMGDPGVRCVEDRDAGSCQWKDAGGQCWNWFSGYRDPIAKDAQVKPDPTVSQSIGTALSDVLPAGLISGGGGNVLLLAGAAVLAFMALSGSGNGKGARR